MRSLYLIPVLLLGCHKTEPAPRAPEAAGTATAQIEQGKQLYVEHCAKCHGDGGQGTDKGPPVVGKEAFPRQAGAGAKRDVAFHTAADVFAWATKNMPGDAPATLTTDQYLAIFAFDLTANGIKLDKPLDGPAAQAIVLHP
ncbi:MAG: c-type cytochrome [Kofleriaceae bacterium]